MVQLPFELQNVLENAIEAEKQISYARPEVYNALVAESDNCTAISASGRFTIGSADVKGATVRVSVGNVGETERFVEHIAADYTDNMFYGVFKSGVCISKEDGSSDRLCWVVTMVFKKIDGVWKLVHRHNTRSTP